ncbi:MAG: nucleoside 2-deoxyribosyltransferase [Anaerolineae bacterium]|nr:nucleoside 2-deoxyribosyltransferase [Anaerolineae bacterium]
MKLYLAIKYHPNQQNRDRVEAISSILEQQGFETVCIVRDVEQWGQVHFTPAELMQRSFAEIEASDVVVIELTEKGVGLGIEAGYAYAKGIPLVTIARKGADISETLAGISQKLFLYDNMDELTQFFQQFKIEEIITGMKHLAQQVAAVWTSPQSGVELISEQRR